MGRKAFVFAGTYYWTVSAEIGKQIRRMQRDTRRFGGPEASLEEQPEDYMEILARIAPESGHYSSQLCQEALIFWSDDYYLRCDLAQWKVNVAEEKTARNAARWSKKPRLNH